MLFLKSGHGDLMSGHYRSQWYRQEASLHLMQLCSLVPMSWLAVSSASPSFLEVHLGTVMCTAGRKKAKQQFCNLMGATRVMQHMSIPHPVPALVPIHCDFCSNFLKKKTSGKKNVVCSFPVGVLKANIPHH